MADPGENAGAEDSAAKEDLLRDSPIADLYLESARELILALTDPIDKETCLVWVDFIRAHKSEVPVLFDYLTLLLFSLHQEVRTVPFDDLPPAVEEFKGIRVDVAAMGQKIIAANREHREGKGKVRQGKSECGGPCSAAEAVPQFEWGCDSEGKDYLVTQKVPGFGRQCYMATSAKELPFWWPAPTGKGDYLSKVAEYMDWLQRKDSTKLGECNRVLETVANKGWWEEAEKLRLKEAKDQSLGFKWHPMSTLQFAKPRLDKDEIENFIKNSRNKGVTVLSMDECADGLHDRTLTDTDKLSFGKNYKDIFSVKSHGISSRPGPSRVSEMESRLNEAEYNKSWIFDADDNEQKACGYS